jgi:benzoate membrane transport protein
LRISLISSALVAALVGYGGTIALVLAAATALNATPDQTASWVFAVCLIKAIGSAALSWRTRVPVVLAWSTPGAALIAATTGITMNEAVGAFVITGLLIVLTGAIRSLGRVVALIPDTIAAAMLAGVLLPFCLKGVGASVQLGKLALPMIAVFVLVRQKNPTLAVLAALAAGIATAYAAFPASLPEIIFPLPRLTFIPPVIRADTVLGLALPLYLVTMASQNLPGFATLRTAGYEPPIRPALMTTGALSAIGGLFGAHTISMAAITAAICLGDDVHPDRNQRWKVGLAYGAVWLLLAALGPAILSVIRSLPPEVISVLVALALFGPLTGALAASFSPVPTRFAATITVSVTASGVSVFGIGAAFWGLLAGLAVCLLERKRQI